MSELEVAGVGQEQGSQEPVMLLRERRGLRRHLAIWVGAPEAMALAAASSGTAMPRPPAHRLMLDVITALGARLDRVRLTALVRDQFHAELDLTLADGSTRALSSRASDAIVLAVYEECPLEAAEAVLAEAGLAAESVLEADDASGTGATGPGAAAGTGIDDIDAAVEELRHDLAGATPEDFRSGDGPTEEGPTEDGPTDDGPTDDGPTEDGPTGDTGEGNGPAPS